MESFDSNQEKLSPETLDRLGRLLMIRIKSQTIPFEPLSIEEDEDLDEFLMTASPQMVEIVEGIADKYFKYFLYSDRDTSAKEKQKIKKEMEKDKDLQFFIERNQAESLTEKYIMWEYLLLESTGGKAKPEDYEMTDEEIRTFFDLIEKYPAEVDRSIVFMNSSLQPGENEDSKPILVPDEDKFHNDRQKILSLRDYLINKIGQKDKDIIHDRLIDDLKFRSMFLKIQRALNQNKS